MTVTYDYLRDGPEIYRQSFAAIRAGADLSRVPPALEPVAVRMIHACGMLDLPADLDWSPRLRRARPPPPCGPERRDRRLRDGGPRRHPAPPPRRQPGRLHPPRTGRARPGRRPRHHPVGGSHRPVGAHLAGAVVAIGNAPTALFRLLELLADPAFPRPAAIIGVPVGFVGSAESKAALAESALGVPWLTVHGTRGGSAMAGAAVNALPEDGVGPHRLAMSRQAKP